MHLLYYPYMDNSACIFASPLYEAAYSLLAEVSKSTIFASVLSVLLVERLSLDLGPSMSVSIRLYSVLHYAIYNATILSCPSVLRHPTSTVKAPCLV